ncbi:protein giant-like [Harpegnathos saltator]|nr:protein giant-like [Harpegnathos saltator]
MPVSNTAHPLQLPVTPEIGRSVSMLESIKHAQRPFKAFPKDPLALNTANKSFSDKSSDIYKNYRNAVMEQVKHTENEGTNSKMRRISNRSGSPTSTIKDQKDEEKTRAYLERRRKNNEAAKRSRDARRAKEDEIAIRAAFLQQENTALKNAMNDVLNKYKDTAIHPDLIEIVNKHYHGQSLTSVFE